MPGKGLTEQQVDLYRKEGYLVLPSFLDDRVLHEIDTTIQQMAQQALGSEDQDNVLELEPELVNGQPVVRRLYNPYDNHETFRKLAGHERLVDAVASVLGSDLNLQHSKLNLKPARVGTVVEWHQDLAYLPHTNDDLMTVLIYLDDTTAENSCLRVIPRCHTHYFDHHTEDGYFAGMITEDVESGKYGHPVNCEGPAGSVVFMHAITPHSSLPNRSDKPRRTLIFEYRAADSFPIQWDFNAGIPPEVHRPIRGKRARFARFGGPKPYIPLLRESYTSIYNIQSQTKNSDAFRRLQLTPLGPA
jgi:ectoine hydroxylase-related dioxygenase (phytanoyl-CoA dioxygenase family)